MEYTNEELFAAASLNLQRGRARQVGECVRELIDRGMPPDEILNRGLIKGMEEVGLRFRDNEIFVPEVLVAARAMICGMNVLRPYIVDDGRKPVGQVVLGTVRGDIHDIGKNLVRMMMESKRIEVIDLGTDVTAARFVQAVRQYNPKVQAADSISDAVRRAKAYAGEEDLILAFGSLSYQGALIREVRKDAK